MLSKLFRNPGIDDAFRWSNGERLNARSAAIAALGIAVPVLAGWLSGHEQTGFTIGLGAMLLSASPASPGSPGSIAGGQAPAGPALLPVMLAVASATLIAGTQWADVGMIGLAAAAAALSGYSRPVGAAAIRFIIYLVLCVTLLVSAGEHRNAVAAVFGLGAVWNLALRTMLRPRPATATDPGPPARKPTAAQLRANWRRTMRTLPGWQFPLRFAIGLAIATALRHLWPSHHYVWIVLTVALLTQRPIEAVPVKTIQRAIGTALGVALTWAVLSYATSPLTIAAAICVLGTGAALARSGNYLAYSVLSTPVILLVIDHGKPVESALLTDRLVATALGAMIVIALNLALARIVARG